MSQPISVRRAVFNSLQRAVAEKRERQKEESKRLKTAVQSWRNVR